MEYNFEWDPNKASSNFQKHQVSFAWATSVFKDPLAMSIIDKEHSEGEERWITLGQADNGQCLVVVHTFQEQDGHVVMIRIISARLATNAEQRHYETKP